MNNPSITTSNLQSLTELMIAEDLQYKKCLSYVSQVSDHALQVTLGEMANRHKLRFSNLYNYLNSHQ